MGRTKLRAVTHLDVSRAQVEAAAKAIVEVLSPSSAAYDAREKRNLYEWLGATEYVLFTPGGTGRPARLQGYRRNEAGVFEPWVADADGRLWSTVLELYLLAQGADLRAQQRDGQLLLTHQEEAELRRQEADLRRQEAELRRQEEERRERAEADVARLRAELERLRGQQSS